MLRLQPLPAPLPALLWGGFHGNPRGFGVFSPRCRSFSTPRFPQPFPVENKRVAATSGLLHCAAAVP